VSMRVGVVCEQGLVGAALSVVCTGLMLLPSASGVGKTAPSEIRVSVAIDDAKARASGPGLTIGIRRALQQDSLLVERADLRAGRGDLGMIPNRIKLVARPGYFQIADRTWFRRVVPDSARAAEGEPDSLILIRAEGIIEQIEDIRVYPPGTGLSHLEPQKAPDTWFVTTRIAACAPSRQADSLEWVELRARWRERAETWDRAQEIQGWMVGMTALQLLYRREQWLPDTVDLVFESRGRNR